VEGLEALAGDSATLKKVVKFIMANQPEMSATLFANTPDSVSGHQYAAISNRYFLSESALKRAFDLGEHNVRRLLIRTMVNGAIEYPISDKQSIEQQYVTQLFGRVPKPISTSNADNWNKKHQSTQSSFWELPPLFKRKPIAVPWCLRGYHPPSTFFPRRWWLLD
jgi:hypothetical protein